MFVHLLLLFCLMSYYFCCSFLFPDYYCYYSASCHTISVAVFSPPTITVTILPHVILFLSQFSLPRLLLLLFCLMSYYLCPSFLFPDYYCYYSASCHTISVPVFSSPTITVTILPHVILFLSQFSVTSEVEAAAAAAGSSNRVVEGTAVEGYSNNNTTTATTPLLPNTQTTHDTDEHETSKCHG